MTLIVKEDVEDFNIHLLGAESVLAAQQSISCHMRYTLPEVTINFHIALHHRSLHYRQCSANLVNSLNSTFMCHISHYGAKTNTQFDDVQ